MTETLSVSSNNQLPKDHHINEYVDVLIMIPTGNEAEVIQQVFKDNLPDLGFVSRQRRHGVQGVTYFVKKLEGGLRFTVAIYCSDFQGNTNTASYAAMLWLSLRPKLIISAGIAGSLDASKAWIGDVILPTKIETAKITKIYNAKNEAPEQTDGVIAYVFAPDLKSIKKNKNSIPIRIEADKCEVNATMTISNLDLEKIENNLVYQGTTTDLDRRKTTFSALQKSLKSKFDLDVEPPAEPRLIRRVKTFSWDKVLDSPRVYNFLKSELLSHDNVCVEMESWGFNLVSALINYKYPHGIIIVRGISDIIGSKDDSDQKSEPMEGFCREYALNNVAKTCVRIIADELEQ